MGRLQLLVLGMMLLALSTAPAARGQNTEPGRPPASPDVQKAGEADRPEPPLPLAVELSPATDPKGPASDEPPPVRIRSKPGNDTASNSKFQTKPSLDDRSEKAGEGTTSVDPGLVKAGAEAPAQAGAPARSPSPNSPEGAPATETASDRLPVGKQSVAVTVDVQSPISMNLNQESTMKLIVRNTGASDALNVRVDDELPEGLQCVSTQPEAKTADAARLIWLFPTLQAGSEKVIMLRVKPTKTGPFDHVATVTFMSGSRSRTTVFQPRLKVDMVVNPSVGKVLKGQPVEFKVSVTNTGDGTARGVSIKAKLSPGLRKESDDREFELTLPDLAPGKTETLDPLVADALIKGEQSCTVTATSTDVVFNKDEAECTKTIVVVAPELKLVLNAPESRYTDTIADYEINLENIGTAPARRVRVVTTLPVKGKLMKIPPGADYDRATRKLQWKIDVIDANKKENLAFQVKMAGSGEYQCVIEAVADNTPRVSDRRQTEVMGMAVVELDVFEPKRVVDVDGTTTFQIRLTNSGTKDATNLEVTAELSKNLKVMAAGGSPKEIKSEVSETGDSVRFNKIDKLSTEKEIVLGIKVKILSATPRLATCRVKVTYDDMPEPIDDMAGVKVTTTRRTAAAPTTKQ